MLKVLFSLCILFGVSWAQAQVVDSQPVDERIIVVEDMSAEEIQALQAELEEQGLRGPFKWACYAENRYREVFRGVSSNRRRAEREALGLCYRWSRRCYMAGCERIISIPF